jgi:hypothetical protein
MTRKDRATVTLDTELLTSIKNRVGERGVSRYLNGALRKQLQHDSMGEYLAERERERGPIPEDILRRAASLIDSAYEPVNRERVKLRIGRVFDKANPSVRLADIIAEAKRRRIPLEKVLGKRAEIAIDGNEISVVDVEIPEEGWS